MNKYMHMQRSTIRGEKAEKFRVWDEVPSREVPLFLETAEFPWNTMYDTPRYSLRHERNKRWK